METKDCPCPPAAVFTIYAIVFRLTGAIVYAGHTLRRDVADRIYEHGANCNWEHPVYQAFFQAGLSPRWDMKHIIVKEIPFYGTVGTREYKKWFKDCREQEKKYIQFLARTQKSPLYNIDHNPNGWSVKYAGKGLSPDESYYIRDNGKVKRLNNPNAHIMKMIQETVQFWVDRAFRKTSAEYKKIIPENDYTISMIQEKMWESWLNAPRSIICKEWSRRVKEYHGSLRVSEEAKAS